MFLLQPKYKRVLLKLSGESLAGKQSHGIDFDTVLKFCQPVKTCVDMGVEVAIVVGGGEAAAVVTWTEPEQTTWVCWQR